MKKFWRRIVVDKREFFYRIGKSRLAIRNHGSYPLHEVCKGWTYEGDQGMEPSDVAWFISEKDYFGEKPTA
jgi:hypothetical protein